MSLAREDLFLASAIIGDIFEYLKQKLLPHSTVISPAKVVTDLSQFDCMLFRLSVSRIREI